MLTTRTESQTLLLMFLTEWLIWIHEGAKEHKVFTRNHGLCHQLSCWMNTVPYMNFKSLNAVLGLMSSMFEQEFTFTSYPFNKGWFDNTHDGYSRRFTSECIYKNTHKNKQRLKWVRKTITHLSSI